MMSVPFQYQIYYYVHISCTHTWPHCGITAFVAILVSLHALLGRALFPTAISCFFGWNSNYSNDHELPLQ